MNLYRSVGAGLRLSVWIAAVSSFVAASAWAAHPVDSVTVTINNSTSGKVLVPSQFAGMFEASNMGRGVFDPTQSKTSEYENIIRQMQVTHWRVEGASSDQEPNFFTFLQNSGCPPTHSLMWGLWLYNEPHLGSDNPTNATLLMENTTEAPYIDAFAFGNEIQYDENINRDKYVNGYNSNKATPPVGSYIGAKEYWDQQRTWVNQALANDGLPVASYMGCDAGGSAADGTDYQVFSFADHTKHTWFMSFVLDEVANIKAATQHLYVHDGHNIPVYGTAPWLPTAQQAAAFSNGIPYALGDVVSVTDTSGAVVKDSHTNVPLYYQYTASSPHVFYPTTTPTPPNDTGHTYWRELEPDFVAGLTYKVGDVVRDEKATYGSPSVSYPGTLYQCVLAQASVDHPSLAIQNSIAGHYPCMWVLTDPSQFACEGPHLLAMYDLHPQQQTDWGTILTHRLGSGTAGWPTKSGAPLPFRMTEFSPFSGPQNGGWIDNGTDINYGNYLHRPYNPTTNDYSLVENDSYSLTLVTPGSNSVAPLAARQHTDTFASALIGLEMFHYWARAGAIGVNPEEGVEQTNSPVMEGLYGQPGSDFRALPYAYVWPAFNIGAAPGVGQELPQSAIVQTANSDNFSVYAVDTPTDLFVTVINKSFDYNNDGTHLNGSRDLQVTLSLGSFAPSGFQTMALIPADGTSGDSTSEGSASLGSAILDPSRTSAFPQSWTPTTPATWTGAPVSVPAFTAKIIDLKK